MSCFCHLTDRVKYCEAPVHGNDDDDVRRQIETKQLEVLDQLTGEVPGVPLDGDFPDDVRDVAEERHDEVGSCQVPDEYVDRRCAELAAAVGAAGTVSVAVPTTTQATENAGKYGAVSGQLRRSCLKTGCPCFMSED